MSLLLRRKNLIDIVAAAFDWLRARRRGRR